MTLLRLGFIILLTLFGTSQAYLNPFLNTKSLEFLSYIYICIFHFANVKSDISDEYDNSLLAWLCCNFTYSSSCLSLCLFFLIHSHFDFLRFSLLILALYSFSGIYLSSFWITFVTYDGLTFNSFAILLGFSCKS